MIFIVGLMLIASMVALWSYFFLRRIALTLNAPVRTFPWRLSLLALSLLVGFLTLYTRSGLMAIVLHLMGLSLLLRFVNFLVRLIAASRYEPHCRAWRFLYGVKAIPILLTAVIMIYGYINVNTVVATSYTVTTAKSIRAEGYRAVMLSDIHYGVTLNEDEFRAVAEEIEALKPDFVLLCGDIVDDDTEKAELTEIFSVLGSIESTYGTFFSYGNHDRPFKGMPSEFTSAYGSNDLVRIIEESGITLLCDESYTLNGEVTLVGREDRSMGKRKTIGELLAAVDPDNFILVLDHQPTDYRANGRAGTDLLLSGHTHGGQFFPLNFVMGFFGNDAVYGQTAVDEDTVAIVSSGVAGWGFPFKTAAPAEYLVIDIIPS